MDQAFFIHNVGEGETSIMSSRKEDGKGFLASHPPFSLPTKPYGNSDRGFSTRFLLCSSLGSFTLSDYNSTHRDGCSPHYSSLPPCRNASTHLSLTYKTVCHKLFKGLKNVVSVLTSIGWSVYVILCYVVMLLIIYLSIYLEVIVFKFYGIQECMLCCRQNIARC